MPEYRLSMEHITKKFPGVLALHDVQLHVLPGTVHALMGENGAGKSTLMNCLFGIYKIDGGSIFLEGKDITCQTPQKALENGISMIHQELDYIPYQTVTDNLWVGRYLKKGLIVDEKMMRKKTDELLQKFGFDIDPQTYAKDLSISQLQALEIVKAVSCDAKIIIMDEPTSSLTIAESGHLFRIMIRAENRLRNVGEKTGKSEKRRDLLGLSMQDIYTMCNYFRGPEGSFFVLNS